MNSVPTPRERELLVRSAELARRDIAKGSISLVHVSARLPVRRPLGRGTWEEDQVGNLSYTSDICKKLCGPF